MNKRNCASIHERAKHSLHKFSPLASENLFFSIIIGSLAFFYHFRFSLHPLDIYNIGWLCNDDMAGPLLGWLHFLHEDWQLPLGHLSNPMTPIPSSLSLMDAIPFASIILKAIGLPKGVYQYHGYWFLFCSLLQAYAGLKILSLFIDDSKKRFLGSAFLTFSPILLYRTMHVSLCAHWLVLFSIYGILKWQKLNKVTLFYWLILLFCAITVHPYFILFTLTFAFFSCFRYLWNKDERLIRNHLKAAANLMIILGFTLGIAAIFDLTNFAARKTFIGGLDFYTADAFMFFNSAGKAVFAPELWKLKMGQYEGFSYLGLGSILLLFIYCIDNVGSYKQNWKNNWRSPLFGPCLAAISALSFFSLGSNIRFFGIWLIDLSFLYEPFRTLLGSFRANGRYIWAAFYFVTLLLMVYRPKNSALQNRQFLLLSLAFIVQLIDISPLRPTLRERRIPSPQELFGTLALDGIKKISIVPPETNNDACEGFASSNLYVAFNIYAAAHNMNINSSYRAHPPAELFQKMCKDSIAEINEQKLDKSTAYILRKQLAKNLPQEFLSVHCQDLSTHHICNPKFKEK